MIDLSLRIVIYSMLKIFGPSPSASTSDTSNQDVMMECLSMSTM